MGLNAQNAGRVGQPRLSTCERAPTALLKARRSLLIRWVLSAQFEFGLPGLRFVFGQTEAVQIHGGQNRSVKILFHGGDASLLLGFVLRIVVIEENRLRLGFGGKLSEAVDGEMFLFHVRGKLLFAGRRPVVTGSHLVNEAAQLVQTLLDFGNENVGARRKFHDRITGTGVSGKYHHAMGRLNTVGIGLEMRAELLRHERVMGILGGRDLNLVIAVNNSFAVDFMDDKGTGQAMVWPTKLEPGFFRSKHFKGNADVAKGGFDQFARLRRPLDIDLPRVGGEIKVEVIVGHHVDEAEVMVRVQVGKEDGSNRFRRNPNLDQATDGPSPTVD